MPTAEVTETRTNEHQLPYGGKAPFICNHLHLTEVNDKQLAVSDLASYGLRKSEPKDFTRPDEYNTRVCGAELSSETRLKLNAMLHVENKLVVKW